MSVVIVGGGVVGSSIAFHLKRDGFPGRVLVVERDSTYARASSARATGGIRQQYGSTLNVQMARFGLAFYQRFDPRIRLRQRGYLFLANGTNAERLELRFERRRAAGANVERWTVDRIRQALPDAMLDDIEFAVFGPEDGYYEPREVLAALRGAAVAAGVEYVEATVVAIEEVSGRVSGVVVRDGRIPAATVVNATGAWAGRVAALAGISVPVAPVRQTSFRVALPHRWE